jgi:hypothetical protein
VWVVVSKIVFEIFWYVTVFEGVAGEVSKERIAFSSGSSTSFHELLCLFNCMSWFFFSETNFDLMYILVI